MQTLWVALGSGLATFTLYFLLVLLGFALLGFSFGWQLRRLLPENRDRLPRKVWVAACIIASLTTGALSGVDVGGIHGVLAMGDSLAEERFVLLHPLSGKGEGGAGGRFHHLEASLEAEIREFRGWRWVPYAAGNLLLGSWFDPLVMAAKLGRSYLAADPAPAAAPRTLRTAWEAVRGDLAGSALRKIAFSLITGVFTLIGLVLVGALALLVSWKELREGLPAAPAPRANRGRIARNGCDEGGRSDKLRETPSVLPLSLP
jgi:hypothetical protein